MKWYEVTYEVRLLGAIGIFTAKTSTVLAGTPEEAFEKFRRRWCHKYEFRFPIMIKEQP